MIISAAWVPFLTLRDPLAYFLRLAAALSVWMFELLLQRRHFFDIRVKQIKVFTGITPI